MQILPRYFRFRVTGPEGIFRALSKLKSVTVNAFNTGVVRRYHGETPFLPEELFGNPMLLSGMKSQLAEMYDDDAIQNDRISLPTQAYDRMRVRFESKHGLMLERRGDRYALLLVFPAFSIMEGDKGKLAEFSGESAELSVEISGSVKRRDGKFQPASHLTEVASRIMDGTYISCRCEFFHHRYQGWVLNLVTYNQGIDCLECGADSWEEAGEVVVCMSCGHSYSQEVFSRMMAENLKPLPDVSCGIMIGLSTPLIFSSTGHERRSVFPGEAEHMSGVIRARVMLRHKGNWSSWEERWEKAEAGYRERARRIADGWRRVVYEQGVRKTRASCIWMLRHPGEWNYFTYNRLHFFEPSDVMGEVSSWLSSPQRKHVMEVRFMDEEFTERHEKPFDPSMLFRLCHSCGRLYPSLPHPLPRDKRGRFPLFECVCGTKTTLDANAAKNLAGGEETMGKIASL